MDYGNWENQLNAWSCVQRKSQLVSTCLLVSLLVVAVPKTVFNWYRIANCAW